MSGRKISSLLSMWEKKAEESNNNNSATNTAPPKRTIFKKNVESKPVDVPVVSSEKTVETIPSSSNNEIIRNDPASNSSQPSAPLEETMVETNIEQVPSAPPLDETSHIETTQVETSSPTIENSLEETSQVVVEEIIPPPQEEDNSTQVDQEIPSIPDETQQIDIPSAPIPEETIETPQIEETTIVETQEETPSEPIPEETPEETTIQGDFKVSLSEFKAVVGCSIMASSLEPLQKQLNFILEQNNCTRKEDLPAGAIGVFDSLKVTLDMYMQNVFTPSSVLSSLLQQISTRGVTEEVKVTMRVVLRHMDVFESDVSSLYSLSSLLIQLAFGTQDKIDLMMEFLRNPKAKALIRKIAPEPSFKTMFGSLYPTLARTDFKFFYENYSETYFKSDLPPTLCASYCGQVYKEALRFPEYIEPFISEAVFSLVELAKLRNEPIEKLFCNGLYNMVKEAPEKFFKSEKYDDYVKALEKVKEQLFDSNKVFIEELFDLKNGMISDDSGEATAGEDFILMIEFNGKKKKTKESGNITFAQLVSSILEKFQVQQEHQSMNDLFDKGVIIEYFEESIKDWVEFERIEDIPRSPKVAKIKIVKEEIQINQISQIIERNTNIQLVNDKYQILKRIGKGGFGSVYSAYAYSSTESKPSLCALKYIEIDSIVNFNRSMREGIQMLQLDHANIARISDVFEVQSSDIGIMGVETKRYLCFAMPLYSHGDLYELIKNQSQIITAKLLGSIMKQLMDSLTYLHDEYSIVHRDIKPQNVLIESIDLINKTLKPILSDFGLAKTLLKTETQVAGTASYMSPEMSSRRGYNLSTDIWSMGVMFYQLLSFDFITDVKGKVQNNEFDSLATQIERTWSGQDLEIISSLKKLTFDMLNLNPEERPTAKQVFESLSAY